VSAGAIAVTAIIVSGVQVTAIVGAGAWLIHHKRILFAATPKPQAQQQDKSAAGQQVPAETVRRLPA
jgi:hypothetical protein